MIEKRRPGSIVAMYRRTRGAMREYRYEAKWLVSGDGLLIWEAIVRRQMVEKGSPSGTINGGLITRCMTLMNSRNSPSLGVLCPLNYRCKFGGQAFA